MNNISLVWATPNAEPLIAYMARVSNPENQSAPEYKRLIKYLIKHKHWSPFEMASVCMEINTTRDIARQMLRHRSFSFQEFSQRYAEADGFMFSDTRMQDYTNRQSSLPCEDRELDRWWKDEQARLLSNMNAAYKNALTQGIAKEVARKILPEGLTLSKMYMSGTLRSWLHYVDLRTGVETQEEHRLIALLCKDILAKHFPTIMEAFNESNN